MDETTKNFWKAWQEWDRTPPPPLYFRLYHDQDGNPICYSREDQPGTFIDVTPMDFALADMNVQVVKGQLVRIRPVMTVNKLTPSDTGTACHPQDVTVVVSEHIVHRCWRAQAHEI